MRPRADLIVFNAGQLVTMDTTVEGPRRGPAMGDINAIADGAVAVADGRIVFTGTLAQVTAAVESGPETRRIDAQGGLVTPGLVDAHTHLVFAGNRAHEFELKTVRGLSYEQIEARGGGVLATVAETRTASRSALMAQARRTLRRMLHNGTTTIEAKSGYALTTAGEIKLLEVMQTLDAQGPVEIVPTLFGAHDMPLEFRDNPGQFLELIISEMLPAVAERRLARFCDSGVTFAVDDTARLFEAAQDLGLGVKVHADEFRNTGGAALAARCGAVSAEHCLNSEDQDLDAMRAAGVIAVLLPAVPLVHRLGCFVNARRFIDRGLAVALGSDFNPSCPVESLPLVIALACYTAGMTPAEALSAATVNAAHAVGRGADLGSLTPGKQADLVIWEVANHLQLCERLGGALVKTVIKKGRVVFQTPPSE